MPAKNVRTSPRVRSRVTNGATLFFEGVDGRSGPARRFRDLFAAYCQDLGGVEAMSEGQKSLARRAASLSMELEQREAAQVGAGKYDGPEYSTIANTLGRLIARLGIERSPAAGAPSTGKLSDEDLAKLSTQELVSLYRSIT